MKLIFAALLTVMSLCAHARMKAMTDTFQKGFVKVRPGQRLYVEYRKAVAGKPTIFFLNGLTWSTREWQPLLTQLDQLDPELGIVLYDMEGMGKTLLDKAPINFDIPFENQIKDLKDLYNTLNISGPLVLAGLSYGGAAALQYLKEYPNDFQKVIAMSPFLARLESQEQWIQTMIKNTRAMNPYNPATDEELYDYYLRYLVYTTYPIAEPIMLENPYKSEGVFRMVKGIKDWKASDIVAQFPKSKLHVMGGENDPYVLLPQLTDFWKSLPSQVGNSFIIFKNTQHKLPEDQPLFTAKWMMQILQDNPALYQGLTFQGDPATGIAQSGSIIIPLNKVSSCESLLRTASQPR